MNRILAILNSAMIGDVPSLDIRYEEIEGAAERLNSANEDLRTSVKTLMGEQRVNLEVGQISLKVEMKGIGIRSMEEGSFPEPTVEASTNRQTLKAVLTAEDTYKELKKRLKSGDIEYKGRGLGNQLRFLLLKPLLMF